MFSRFRKHFDQLPHCDQILDQLNLSPYSPEVQDTIKKWIGELLLILQNQLTLKRDDYRKFVDLCLVFLGVNNTIAFKKPGALHKARWMAKLIYSIKMRLLESEIEQLPPGIITSKTQLPKLRDFANFATLIFGGGCRQIQLLMPHITTCSFIIKFVSMVL